MQSPISLLHMDCPVGKILLIEPLMVKPKGGEEGGLKSHVDGKITYFARTSINLQV